MSLEHRPLDPLEGDLERFAACFAENGDPRDLRQLRWQYLDNPVSRSDPTGTSPKAASYVDLAIDSETDKVAAIYATFPVELQIGGHRVVGVQSLDTLTDASHRTQGLFPKLATSVYDRCRARGVALVYGFPNGDSASGFFQTLGWSRLDPVPYLFLPLRARFLLKRAGVPGRIARLAPDRVPARQPAPLASADEEVAVSLILEPAIDALWEQFSQHVRIAVIRDRRYLSWRLDRPGARYKVLVFRRAGELRGLAVITCLERHGGKVGYVMELLHVPGDRRAGELLLNAAVDDLDAQGADVVLAWSLEHSPTRTTFRQVGFRTLPVSLRPSELHFGARALDAPPDAAIGNRRNWYVSYLDAATL